MVRKTLFTLTVLLLAVTCNAAEKVPPAPSQATSATERRPFYVTLAFHFDVPFPWESGPTPATATPTSTLTATPTPTATATPAASGAGITDPDLVVTPAPLPLQPLGTPFVDPAFSTTLRRLSNASAGGSFGTHIYSQLQAFSSDNAYVLLIENGDYVVRRVDDLSLVSGLDTSQWNAPRWLPVAAKTAFARAGPRTESATSSLVGAPALQTAATGLEHRLIHFDTNADTTLRVQVSDVDTLSTTTVFTFPVPYERVRVNQSFDELSDDGRWLGGMASLSSGDQMIFALDLQNLALGAQLSLAGLYAGPCQPDPEWGEIEPDWVGISPLGNYLVVQWPRDGTERCSGLETFDLQSGAFVGRVYDGHQHGDLGVGADGVSEFFMTYELYHPSGNASIGVRALPGPATGVSPPTYVRTMGWFGEHISCQGPHGVCMITTYGDASDGWSALEGELFLQYSDGRVLRLAHHRSSSCGYWVQPRASISTDGRYVVFASDWAQGTGSDSCAGGNDLGAGDAYLIDLAAGPSPTPWPTCLVDANDNGQVDVLDIQWEAGWWHQPGFPAEADVNDDSVVNIVDVMAVAGQLGQSCTSR